MLPCFESLSRCIILTLFQCSYIDALELVFPAMIGPVLIGFPALLGRASWSCDLSLYNDTKVCDCGCLSRDPDCDNAANPVHGCADGLVCAQDGRCIAQDADSVYVSNACQNIITPGTPFTSGRAYTSATATSSSCPVCPNDMLFNQVILCTFYVGHHHLTCFSVLLLRMHSGTTKRARFSVDHQFGPRYQPFATCMR